MKDYGIRKNLDMSFDQAVEKVKLELSKEGFGILTQIDVKETLKKKLDVDVDNYIILGACKPEFAYQALQIEQELGLLLPCNVIVYEKKGEVVVSVIDPEVSMGFIENKGLESIASTVKGELTKVISNL